MQNVLHYTNSFFPNDDIKKEMELKVWSKPIYGYSLNCDSSTLIDTKNELQSEIEIARSSSIYELRDLIKSRKLGILVPCVVFPAFPAFPFF